MKLIAVFSLLISIISISLQSLNYSYSSHLGTDLSVFHSRSVYFWKNLTLTNLGHNEYQPGAIIFFIILGGVASLVDNTIDTFKWALFIINITFIILIGLLLHKMHKTAGIILLSVLLIFLGPILLFRFDLLVILLLTLVFYLWEKDKPELGVVILSWGILIKVYPIIFLPYLLWLSFKKYKFTKSLYLFSIFLSSLIISFLLYTIIFQISPKDTLTSYNFHSLKSVATESIWASLIYSAHILRGIPLPAFESDFGINAISRQEIFLSMTFYNFFWILPLGILNLYYFLKKKTFFAFDIDYKFLAFNLLVFLIFSKVLFVQYLAWFLFMVPLIDIKILLRKGWFINIFLIIVTTILHTFIYPLNYSGWLDVLNTGNIDLLLLWTVLISNFLLIVLGIRIGIDVYKNHK